MTNPYETLGVPPDADDAAIRDAYLALARRFTPENDPVKFAAIRAAYDAIRTLESRARHRLFEAGKAETIDAILEDAACRTPRRRPGLTLPPLRRVAYLSRWAQQIGNSGAVGEFLTAPLQVPAET